jgi:hypothetical protein
MIDSCSDNPPSFSLVEENEAVEEAAEISAAIIYLYLN